MTPGQTIVSIIGCVVIILGAYFATYYIGKQSIQSASGRGMKLRDRMSVSRDKGFYTIEAGGKVYLVAMTSHSAALLDSYPAEEFAADSAAGSSAALSAAPTLARLASNFVAAIKRGAPARNAGLSDLEKRITLQKAQEEDNIDRVFREIQQRRSARERGKGEGQ
jgi:hypothetical protein